MTETATLYRYHHFVCYDCSVRLSLEEFSVLRTTPKGFWIKDHNYKERWVSGESRKRYAYPSVEEALDAFILRKARHLEILKSQATVIGKVLALAKNPESTKRTSKYHVDFTLERTTNDK